MNNFGNLPERLRDLIKKNQNVFIGSTTGGNQGSYIPVTIENNRIIKALATCKIPAGRCVVVLDENARFFAIGGDASNSTSPKDRVTRYRQSRKEDKQTETISKYEASVGYVFSKRGIGDGSVICPVVPPPPPPLPPRPPGFPTDPNAKGFVYWAAVLDDPDGLGSEVELDVDLLEYTVSGPSAPDYGITQAFKDEFIPLGYNVFIDAHYSDGVQPQALRFCCAGSEDINGLATFDPVALPPGWFSSQGYIRRIQDITFQNRSTDVFTAASWKGVTTVPTTTNCYRFAEELTTPQWISAIYPESIPWSAFVEPPEPPPPPPPPPPPDPDGNPEGPEDRYYDFYYGGETENPILLYRVGLETYVQGIDIIFVNKSDRLIVSRLGDATNDGALEEGACRIRIHLIRNNALISGQTHNFSWTEAPILAGNLIKNKDKKGLFSYVAAIWKASPTESDYDALVTAGKLEAALNNSFELSPLCRSLRKNRDNKYMVCFVDPISTSGTNIYNDAADDCIPTAFSVLDSVLSESKIQALKGTDQLLDLRFFIYDGSCYKEDKNLLIKKHKIKNAKAGALASYDYEMWSISAGWWSSSG